MTVEAKILADSINGNPGPRLTTWQLCFPKFILPQVLTHRQFSRNAQSSRALPTGRLIGLIEEDPAMPVRWGKNKRGMVAEEDYADNDVKLLNFLWLKLMNQSISMIETIKMCGYNIHKQIINRILEPWAHVKMIVSTTHTANFMFLRKGHDAQPEIQELADKMEQSLITSIPKILGPGEWHIPLVSEEEKLEIHVDDLVKISTGRCARVSYLTHEGVRDTQKDIELHNRLLKDGHWSPFEHCAFAAVNKNIRRGNFTGFVQYRKMFKEKECKKDSWIMVHEDGYVEYVDQNEFQ